MPKLQVAGIERCRYAPLVRAMTKLRHAKLLTVGDTEHIVEI